MIDSNDTAGAGRWRIATQVVLLFFLMLRVGISPSFDLDPTWTEVLGWAHLHGLKAGVDYVFTYGPLGFLYPLAGYTPGAGKAFLNAQIVLALGQALVVAAALRHRPAWSSVVCVAIFVLWLPWVAGDLQWYATFAFAFVVAVRIDDLSHPACIAVLVLIPALLAAIALIKFTSMIVFILWTLGAIAAHLFARRHGRALLLATSAVFAYFLLWHFSGQPLSTWPEYMHASFDVAAGYTAAMGQADESVSIGIAVAAFAGCAMLVASVLMRDRATRTARFGGLFLLGLLALVWRAGATRYGHWQIFFGFACILPYCALCLRSAFSLRAEVVVSAFSLLASLVLLGAVHAQPQFLWAETHATLSSNVHALFHRKSFMRHRRDEWLAFEHNVHLPRIKAAVQDETVDVLTVDQGIILAMGLRYDPRPIFQSYSAYTPELARRNEAHFGGSDAPKFVILRMQPIDGRLPMQEDGLALIMLLRRYRPRLIEAGYLLLERSEKMAEAVEPMPEAANYKTAQLGSAIDLDRPGQCIVLYADVRPSLLGRLRALLLREPALALEVTTRSGITHRFRLLRATARSGFLISPLLTKANDWLDLAGSQHDEIVDFRIDSQDGADRGAFDPDIRYAALPLDATIAMTDLGAFTPVAPYPSFSNSANDQSQAFDVIEENAESVVSMHAPAWIEFSLGRGNFSASGVAGIRDAALTDGGCASPKVDGVALSLMVTEDGQAPVTVWQTKISPWTNAGDRGLQSFVTPNFTVARHALVRMRIDPGANNICDWSYLGKLRFRSEAE